MRNARIVLLFTFLLVMNNLDAQSEKKPTSNFADHLWYGFNIGGIGISSNSFQIGVAPMGGYNINKLFSVGLITKLNYEYSWRLGGETSHFFDYGIGALGRAKLFKGKYFAHVEYDRISITEYDGLNQQQVRKTYPFIYVGGGISYPSGNKWSSELLLLYNVHPESSQVYFPLSISYSLVYNF